MKRAIDVVVSAVALLVLLVPLAVIAAVVRLTSRGPVLYWSERVGRANRNFLMPKLMDVGAAVSHFEMDAGHRSIQPDFFLHHHIGKQFSPTPIAGMQPRINLRGRHLGFKQLRGRPLPFPALHRIPAPLLTIPLGTILVPVIRLLNQPALIKMIEPIRPASGIGNPSQSRARSGLHADTCRRRCRQLYLYHQ